MIEKNKPKLLDLDANFLPPKYSISDRTSSFAPLKKAYNNPNYWISDL
jgi:hypothetical protein